MNEETATKTLRWHPGDMAGHKLAKGLVVRVVAVSEDGLVKAKVVNKGETHLWEGNVTTFRTEYLIPV